MCQHSPLHGAAFFFSFFFNFCLIYHKKKCKAVESEQPVWSTQKCKKCRNFPLWRVFLQSLVLLTFKMKPIFKISNVFLRQIFCSPGSSSSECARDDECQYVNNTLATSNGLGNDRMLKDCRVYQHSGLVSKQMKRWQHGDTISNQCTWFSTAQLYLLFICAVCILSAKDCYCFLCELQSSYWCALLFCHFRGGRGGGGTRHNCSSYVLSVCARCLDRPTVRKTEGCSK